LIHGLRRIFSSMHTTSRVLRCGQPQPGRGAAAWPVYVYKQRGQQQKPDWAGTPRPRAAAGRRGGVAATVAPPWLLRTEAMFVDDQKYWYTS
jgi:hypothetical protein